MTTPARVGRPRKYPWDDWFAQLDGSGSSIRLKHGRDFGLEPALMRKQFLAEARRRNVGIRTSTQRGGWLRVDWSSRRKQYPWDRWLDGQQQRIEPGVDFVVDLEIFREQARRAAKERGLGFRSKTFRGALWIQALRVHAEQCDLDVDCSCDAAIARPSP